MGKAKFPIIKVNNNIILREFSCTDVDEYFNLYKNPLINKFLPDSMIPDSKGDTLVEIESTIQSFYSESGIYWAIADKHTNKLLGGCGFQDWSQFHSRIEIAYDLNPQYWRRGIMFESLQKIIKFAFFNLNIQRIQATVLEENTASINLLLKLGFVQEGLLRKYKFFKKKMVDVLIFSLTVDDIKKF